LIFSILIKVVNFTSRFAFPEMGRVGHWIIFLLNASGVLSNMNTSIWILQLMD
jgi:hypothetical protein